MGIGGSIGQAFWDGERVVEPEEQLDPQLLRCPECGHVGSIDTFDCAGVDIELAEYGIGPDDNDVFCPACGEDVPAVFAAEEKPEPT
jgi:hypothetical protein